MPSVLKLCIVDDHALMRDGVRAVLSRRPGFSIVGEAFDARSAYKAVEDHRPDVVLVDVALPGTTGITVARELIRRKVPARVLLFSMHLSEDLVADALAVGAHGYVGKEQPAEELVAAIQAVADGQIYISSRVSRPAVEELLRRRRAGSDAGPLTALSPREREVFDLLIQGFTNDAVGSHLFISRRTVETHRAHLLKKLELHSLSDLFRFAARHGLISG